MRTLFRSAVQTLWTFKWWWIVPLGIMLVFFVLLIMTSDITGDAPFQYMLF